jgi:phage terminase large subunit-like protein
VASRAAFALPKAEFDGRLYDDFPQIAENYARYVVQGKVLACRYVIQACQRYLDMLEAAEAGTEKYYFSPEDVVDVCSFIENLPLSKGQRANFVLAPWQIFVLSAVFGFRRDDPEFPATKGTRLVRECFLEVPRGHGKSAILAAIALYCFCCEGEFGSQVFVLGPKEDQARKVFDPIRAILELCPDLVEVYNLDWTLKLVRKDKSDPSAQIALVSSIADREDGHDPHVVIAEELHAQDDALIEVMQSALAKRQQTLFASITTAGRRATGVCWSTRKRLISVLAGERKADQFFGVIYTIDQEELDDERRLSDELTWRKAMPMYGITIDPSSIREEYDRATTQSGAAMLEFRRTRLNIWSNANGGLVHPDRWAECKIDGLDIGDYRKRKAWIGCDLASKNDIAAAAILFEEADCVIGFARYFVPSDGPGFRKESVGAMYGGWARSGHLTVTPGGIIDFDYIEQTLRDWCRDYDVQGIAFDSYQSNSILTRLFNDGLPAMMMPPGVKNISDPCKDLLARIEANAFAHDGNPITEWMAMNVVGHVDLRDNVLPQKDAPNSDNKIDGFAALCMANALRLNSAWDIKVNKPSVYARRGLLGGDADDWDME